MSLWTDLLWLHGHRVEGRRTLRWAATMPTPPPLARPSSERLPVHESHLLLPLKPLRLRLCMGIGDGSLHTQ
ncbi:MAG: hypothetical protein ABI870_15935 [Rhodanobacter sp.]